MPFSGGGVFNRLYSWVTDAANGLNVDATRMDADTNDIVTNGLSLCITKDGQQTVTANIPFANFKLINVGLGTAATDAAIVSNANSSMCEFRMTLGSVTPVTTSDFTGSTLYVTPYKGNRIALYDGSVWHMRASAEMSYSTALSVSTCYDVFCYDNSTVPTLELLAWTNDTTRATALTLQDGVLVKSGAVTRRYLGTIRSDAASQMNDTYAKRHVWNYYNRVRRPMRNATETTDTWNYTTATFRQANANTANQLDYVVGWPEDSIAADVYVFAKNTGANIDVIVAIGSDSTSAMATGCLAYSGATQVAAQYIGVHAHLKLIPSVGRHTLVWLEFSGASGTTVWGGDGGAPTTSQSGIHGEIFA